MPDPRSNGAYSTVATAPSPATTGVSLTLATGDGARFPVGTFDVVLCAANTQPIFVAGSGAANAEIARATRTAGSDVLSLVRAQLGTTARTVVVGDQVFEAPTTRFVDDLTGIPTYAQNLSLLNSFDKIRGVYNWKSSNTRKIDEGMGRAQEHGLSEHVTISDSIGAGCVSSTGAPVFDRLNAWPLAFRNILANLGMPSNGTGIVRIVDSPSYLDSRWLYTGTWTGASGTYVQSSVAASALYFNPDRSGTYIDVLYYDYASTSGAFTVALDGVQVASVTVNGTNTSAAGGSGTAWKILRIPNVTVVANFSQIVLTVTAPGSAGLFFAGAGAWQPYGGFVMHNESQSGSTAAGSGTSSWTEATGNQAPGIVFAAVGGTTRQVTDAASTAASNVLTSATAAFTAQDVGKTIDVVPGSGGAMFPPNCWISGFTSATQVTLSYFQASTGQVANANAYATLSAQTVNIGRPPDCVHIALGVNDMYLNAATPATISAAITTIRNRYPNSDCIIYLEPEPGTAYVSSANYALWEAAIFQLADTLDVPLLDMRDQVGSFTQGQALGWYGDTFVHMSTPTYEMVAGTLAAMVGPASGPMQTRVIPALDNDVVPKWYIDNRRATTATATVTTTVEGVVLRLKIPANTLKVGSTIRYGGMLVPGATTITTTRLRIGTAGTTADAAVVAMSATAATNAAVRAIEGSAAVQVAGATGTFLGIGTETVGAITAAGAASATSGTFDTTKPLYVELTVQNTSSTTTTVKSAWLELIP